MSNVEAIKKADSAPDRIWATVNGMSTRLPDGVRQLVGGWSQDAGRSGAVEYVRASTLEALQRENERLQAEIDRKSSMPGDHRYWEGRYRDEAAENERLRNKVDARALTDQQLDDEISAVSKACEGGFGEGGGSPGEWWYERADELEHERKRRELENQLQQHNSRTALASAGEEHHADK